jgi:hypothetical protein
VGLSSYQLPKLATKAAWRPTARSASARASTAATHFSSKRAISVCSKALKARQVAGLATAQEPSRNRGTVALPTGQRPAPVREQAHEAICIELPRSDPQSIAGRFPGQKVAVAECLA